MNARMRSASFSKLPTPQERAEQSRQRQQYYDENSTGFVTIGGGSVIHTCKHSNGTLYTGCGAQGTGSGQVRTGVSSLKFVAGPATCKRCVK